MHSLTHTPRRNVADNSKRIYKNKNTQILTSLREEEEEKKEKILSACPLTLLCLANLFVQSCQSLSLCVWLCVCVQFVSSSSSSTRTCVVIRLEYSFPSSVLQLAFGFSSSLTHSHSLNCTCPCCTRHYTTHIVHWRFAAAVAVSVAPVLARRRQFLFDGLAAAVRATTTSRRRLEATFRFTGRHQNERKRENAGYGTLNLFPSFAPARKEFSLSGSCWRLFLSSPWQCSSTLVQLFFFFPFLSLFLRFWSLASTDSTTVVQQSTAVLLSCLLHLRLLSLTFWLNSARHFLRLLSASMPLAFSLLSALDVVLWVPAVFSVVEFQTDRCRCRR